MANREEIARVKSVLEAVGLSAMLEDVVDAGEIPYQANLRALKAIDIANDAKKGKKEVKQVMNGLDKLITELDLLRNATGYIAKKASSVIRAPQNDA